MNAGRLAILAKGARSGKSGAAGSALDPPCLAELLIHIKPGRSVQLLGQATVVDAFTVVKSDLSLTAYGAVIGELIYRGFADGETNRSAFETALTALKALDGRIGEPRIVLWEFLLSLAAAIGFGLDLFTCPVCGKQPADIGLHNLLWLEVGAVVCRNCRVPQGDALHLSGESVGLLRLLHRPAVSWQRLRISPAARMEITSALFRHLRYHHSSYESLQSLDMLDRLADD